MIAALKLADSFFFNPDRSLWSRSSTEENKIIKLSHDHDFTLKCTVNGTLRALKHVLYDEII